MQGPAGAKSSPTDNANGSHSAPSDPAVSGPAEGVKQEGLSASPQPHAASAASLAAAKAHLGLEQEQNPAELLVKAAEEAAAARAAAAGKSSTDGAVEDHHQHDPSATSQLKPEGAELGDGQPTDMEVDGETPASPGASSRKRSRQGSDQLDQGQPPNLRHSWPNALSLN